MHNWQDTVCALCLGRLGSCTHVFCIRHGAWPYFGSSQAPFLYFLSNSMYTSSSHFKFLKLCFHNFRPIQLISLTIALSVKLWSCRIFLYLRLYYCELLLSSENLSPPLRHSSAPEGDILIARSVNTIVSSQKYLWEIAQSTYTFACLPIYLLLTAMFLV